MCRSRRELSNAYFPAKFRFDTAENEPCQVCPIEPSTLLRKGRKVGKSALVAALGGQLAREAAPAGEERATDLGFDRAPHSTLGIELRFF